MTDEYAAPIHKCGSCTLNLFETGNHKYSVALLKVPKRYADFQYNSKAAIFTSFALDMTVCSGIYEDFLSGNTEA